ncbi:MAG: dienelactone hydrolase family protein [Cyanobacteria bacterium J06621_11]
MKDYSLRKFQAALSSGQTIVHDVYSKGTGPVVMIIQELPGIGPETLRLADEFEAEGFTVVLPHLFGPLGKTDLAGNMIRVLCMRREFRIFAQGETSPVVEWLRSLCQDLKAQHQVEGIAVIGMCLTGNFALSLMVDDAVLASVASQPALPVGSPGSLHMSQSDIETARQRLDTLEPMLAYRFEGDFQSPAKKFETMDCVFNQDKERIRLKALPGRKHAILTLHFVNEAGHPTRQALDEILSYFRRALTPTL